MMIETVFRKHFIDPPVLSAKKIELAVDAYHRRPLHHAFRHRSIRVVAADFQQKLVRIASLRRAIGY
jgi:nitroreductase